MTNIKLIQELINSTKQLKYKDSNTLDAIEKRAEMLIRKIFGDDSLYVSKLNNIWFYPMVAPCPQHLEIETWESGKNSLINLLNTIIDEVKLFGTPEGSQKTKIDVLRILEILFERFHFIVRQLRDRYNNRKTLDVDDEYDVQDLLHALLRIYFDDIRPEEVTPSYAGSSKRMDFLLKNEEIVVEAKKTRNGLSDKEVGEQLTIDISTYRSHPDCKTLVCFVYDPENRVRNPKGLENDLAKLSSKELAVKVYIFPK